jgi:hypothetical protein
MTGGFAGMALIWARVTSFGVVETKYSALSLAPLSPAAGDAHMVTCGR